MHGTHMRYLIVAGGGIVIGLLAAGTSIQSLLPFLMMIGCPLMMIFMMRGMGGHSGHHKAAGHDAPASSPASGPASGPAGKDA